MCIVMLLALMAPPDTFQPGTIWSGTRTYDDTAGKLKHGVSMYITRRSGESFVGKFRLTGGLIIEGDVQGQIRGNDFYFKEADADKHQIEVRGTISGDKLIYRFKGTGAAGKFRFGKGEMSLQE